MVDILKKALSFGVGSFYMTKEKVEEFVDELVKTNKITPEEGKKVVNETWEKVADFKGQQEKEFKKMLMQTLDEMGVATKKDIERLEKKIGTPAKASAKKAAKSVSNKKK